jgi:ribosome maturation factor RimP
MTHINPQLDKLFAIAGPVCAGAGYELVDLRLVMEHGGWILRVFIDRAAGGKAAESRAAASTAEASAAAARAAAEPASAEALAPSEDSDDDEGLDDDNAGEPADEPADEIDEQLDAEPAETDPALVDLNDCARVSHELSAVLDVEDPIPQHYSLEVSSPGLDRPLRTAGHFRRFLGGEAKIALRNGLDGRRNFRGFIEAVEPPEASEILPGGVEPGARVAVLVDGTTFLLPIEDIDAARLIQDWDAILGSRLKPKVAGKAAKGVKNPQRSKDQNDESSAASTNKGSTSGKPQRGDEAGE